jgi:hypothetical protein
MLTKSSSLPEDGAVIHRHQASSGDSFDIRVCRADTNPTLAEVFEAKHRAALRRYGARARRGDRGADEAR